MTLRRIALERFEAKLGGRLLTEPERIKLELYDCYLVLA